MLSGQGGRDLVRGWVERSQEWMCFRNLIEAACRLLERAGFEMPGEGRGNGGARPQRGQVSRREDGARLHPADAQENEAIDRSVVFGHMICHKNRLVLWQKIAAGPAPRSILLPLRAVGLESYDGGHHSVLGRQDEEQVRARSEHSRFPGYAAAACLSYFVYRRVDHGVAVTATCEAEGLDEEGGRHEAPEDCSMSEDAKTAVNRFEVVFRELERPASFVEPETLVWVMQPDPDPSELREIDELRRAAMEIAAPRPISYTGT